MKCPVLALWIFLLSANFSVGVSTTTLTPNLGELCPGQDVVLTCSTTDGGSMNWFYNGMSIDILGFIDGRDPIGRIRNVTASGFIFSVELVSRISDDQIFASTLSFSADAAMNGHNVSCTVAVSSEEITDTTPQILQITQIDIPSPPTNVRLTSILNNSDSASVTIEWDPPSQGGSPLNYTITTTPDLISGPTPITTSTSTTITISYNTNYTITITASNCRGNGIASDMYTFRIVNCFDPSPADGVMISPFSDTTEGASISFNCASGLEPQREDVSVCSSNGSWVPDPAHRICSTPTTPSPNCGQPLVSSNVSVVSTNNTTMGDTVTLQCKDGLFPVESIIITCISPGVWSPDPAELVCTDTPANCTGSLLPDNVIIINSTSSQLNYTCNCSTSMSMLMTAVCVRDNTWLPQVLCGEDVCTRDGSSGEPGTMVTVIAVVSVIIITIIIAIIIIIIAIVVTRRKKESDFKRKPINVGVGSNEDNEIQLRGYDDIVLDNAVNDNNARVQDSGDNSLAMYSTVNLVEPIARINETQATDDEYSHIQREQRRPQNNPQNVTSDEYSRIQRPKKPKCIKPPEVADEYSHIQRPKKKPKCIKPQEIPGGEQYSTLNVQGDGPTLSTPTGEPPPPPNPIPGEIVYADLGPCHKKPAAAAASPMSPSAAIPGVVYSSITHTLPPSPLPDVDASLDLNMMLIQLKSITSEWFNLGEAIAVPRDYLTELNKMELTDYDKLVEVLDYWFASFPRGSAPKWSDVAKALDGIGKTKLASDIMKVYTTGKLPIIVDDSIPAELFKDETPPPPLPPKIDDDDNDDNLPPPPPIPKKIDLTPAVPARPPKAPPRPPKE